jgi:cell division protein FtsN
LISKAEDIQKEAPQEEKVEQKALTAPTPIENPPKPQAQDAVYKVFIGTYSSADQARVAKEIIQESGSGLNPIVKCIGSNNYTLQVGIFKSKQSAESMLLTVQQNHLPGRIVQEY